MFVLMIVPTSLGCIITMHVGAYNFSYSEKKHPQAGFEPGTLTTNPEHTHALDRVSTAYI